MLWIHPAEGGLRPFPPYAGFLRSLGPPGMNQPVGLALDHTTGLPVLRLSSSFIVKLTPV
ncbi:hypothetical protein AGMMS50256_01520 [Betaproteobacteria bacterium]|nr:hypothetical protein AGMMS50256_01520 [Betaproteobacteria bacterium]